MKFAILVYESVEEYATRDNPEKAPAYWGAYMAYGKALNDAGVAAGGMPLAPPDSGVTLRVRSDKRTVHDGPFADTKEQLGGLFVIDVPDVETALEWASRCPAASTGSVEVRAVMSPPMNPA